LKARKLEGEKAGKLKKIEAGKQGNSEVRKLE
jgi:hypothetical protein